MIFEVNFETSDLTAQNLLDYLKTKDISATFFVVGSRVIERPNVLVEEYMSGHEISVHTWSHRVGISFSFPSELESNMKMNSLLLP